MNNIDQNNSTSRKMNRNVIIDNLVKTYGLLANEEKVLGLLLQKSGEMSFSTVSHFTKLPCQEVEKCSLKLSKKSYVTMVNSAGRVFVKAGNRFVKALEVKIQEAYEEKKIQAEKTTTEQDSFADLKLKIQRFLIEKYEEKHFDNDVKCSVSVENEDNYRKVCMLQRFS
jgi:hypothetical protein